MSRAAQPTFGKTEAEARVVEDDRVARERHHRARPTAAPRYGGPPITGRRAWIAWMEDAPVMRVKIRRQTCMSRSKASR